MLSLWRPYGTRRVAQISRIATAEWIRSQKFKYAVISGLLFDQENQSFEKWLEQTRAEVVATRTVTIAVSAGPQKWYVVKFKDEPAAAKSQP